MRGCVAAALAAAVLPTEAFALPSAAPPQVEAAIKSYARSDRDLRAFYQAIGYRSLWTDGYSVRPEAFRLIHLLSQSNLDGLDPDEYDPDDLAELVDKAQRGDSPKALAKAETRLSRAFAKYVRDLYRPANVGMIYVDRELAPEPPSTFATLSAAARATSLQAHLDSVAQINPMYGQLREGLAEYRERWANLPAVTVPAGPPLKTGATGPRVQLLRQRLGLSPYGPFDKSVAQALRDFQEAHGIPVDGVAGPRTLAVLNQPPWERERLIQLNLERARAVPVALGDRHVVVDAAAARLYLYEDGQVKDTMKVIVGKPNEPTPMIAGLIRYAVLNPYWNVPADLVKSRVAPHVLKQGTGYLKTMGYEVLSDWSDNARPLDPKTIDWKSVAAGRTLIRVRQQPGPHNAMGRMKFMFPNDMGIWLHDTPDKDLFGESARMFSAGCVRVEDAPRLARWLFGKPLKAGSPAPEQHVALAKPVPVYITYLTAAPSDRGIAIRNDIYKRDRERLARAGRSGGSR